MSEICIILFLVIIFYFRNSLDGSYLSPTGILSGIYILMLLLFLIFAGDMFFSLKAGTYILVFVILFLIGELLGITIHRKPLMASLTIRKYSDTFKSNLKIFIIVLSLVSFIGSLLYLNVFISYFGSFQKFLVAGSVIRSDLFFGNISIPTNILAMSLLGYSAVNLALVYYCKYGFRWFLIISFFSIFLIAFSQAGRAGLVIIIFQIFAARIIRYSINSTNVPLSKIFKPLLVIIPLFFIIFMGVENFRYEDFQYSKTTFSQRTETFKVYTFGGISGFTTYLNEIYPEKVIHTYGKYSFGSLFALLGIGKKEVGNYSQFLNVSPKNVVNIYTIFRPFLDDFGMIGFVVIPIFLGFISYLIYYHAIKGNLISVSWIISIYSYLLFSFIAPLTQFNSFLLSLILSPLIISWSKYKL
jgi:oligosaccharide repeat unit polymerase